MVPEGFIAAGGALVAWTAAVGTAVGAADPGAEVAGTAVSCGVAVGDVEPLDDGVAVAEDPQANRNATNSRTIAFGRCLEISGLIANCGTNFPPFYESLISNGAFRKFASLPIVSDSERD